MENPFTRTEWLIGKESLATLKKAHVAIFGVGGVGSYVAEALARSGVGEFTLIDHDAVSISNINRQIHALHSTLGKEKVSIMGERMVDINPQSLIHRFPTRFLPDEHPWDFSYVVDAVDTVPCKIQIVLKAKEHGIPVVSAMGAGNRLQPNLIRVGDIYETKGCPLAKTMRGLCRKNKINRLKVVYSTENPLFKQKNIGSIAFVPSAAGLLIAAEIINDLLDFSSQK
jgi:tRNA A37 threonylcarbamoyladenosine dehydratase